MGLIVWVAKKPISFPAFPLDQKRFEGRLLKGREKNAGRL
jgi:hypothetical protein